METEKDSSRLTHLPTSYTAAKRALLANTSLQDDVKTHMLSSLVAGTVATTICAPADVLKSRVQAASKTGAGPSVSRSLHSTTSPLSSPSAYGGIEKLEFQLRNFKNQSLLQITTQGLRNEGPLFLMKGWTPAWLRLT